MIQNISIERLHPHPDNPRRELGDLSELVDSIQSRGVLQNLTVVPLEEQEDHYRVVIGHRRLAAAKEAGLTELPCAVATMDHKTQVSTMLLENMQRADLTVYEQTQGFQMLLDFGENIVTISEQTGLSQSTVRRRVKLLELDPEKFKESCSRNVTLTDYAALEQIEDIDMRNEVLTHIGTSNFNHALHRALDLQKREAWLAQCLETLETFATKVEDKESGYSYVTSYYPPEEVEIPDDANQAQYCYALSDYGYITLYRESDASLEEVEATRRLQERRELQSALLEVAERAYELRKGFALKVSNDTAKKRITTILKYYLQALHDGDGYYLDRRFTDLFLRYDDQTDDDVFEWILKMVPAQPEKHLFLLVYSCLDRCGNYFSYDNTHQENESLDRVYDFLMAMGYQMSDEEQELRDGTHELFVKEARDDV